MQINPTIFKAYDIRGIYPSEINEEFAYKIGQAMAEFSKAKEIVVGRDTRLSSPSLSQSLINGITESGANVLDVGLVSTPTFFFAVRHLKAPAGIQVSASHNPKEYNGFKVVLRDEKGIIKVGLESGLDKIRNLVLGQYHFVPKLHRSLGTIKHRSLGTIEKISGIQEAEIDDVFQLIPLPDLPSFTVVADPANAMGGQFLEAFFQRLPQINLIKMNFEMDGNFPAHEPNPLIFETLDSLRERVLEEKADFGIAPDGDGDRIFFIDERGEVIPASHITALVAKELLVQYPNEKILYDVRYAWTAKKVIEEFGGVPVMSKVGHALISGALREENGIFAGESSGHFFFRDTGYAEAPLLVLLYLLKALAREKKPLSEIIAPLVFSYESGEINFRLKSREKAQSIVNELEKRYKDGEIIKIDGLAAEFPDWRFSLRPSNTEPLLRLNIEASSKELMEEKRNELIQFIKL